MPYEPINLDPNHHLGYGRGPEGGLVGLIFENGTNKLVGHAVWEEVDVHCSTPTYEPEQPRPLTPEERAAAEALATFLVAFLVEITPVVVTWWKKTGFPALKSALRRAAAALKSKRKGLDSTTPSRDALVAVATDVEVALAEANITMSRAEWAKRYEAMLASDTFSAEQRRLLSVAQIIDLEGDPTQELTPKQFAERIQLKIESNPVLLEEAHAVEVVHVVTAPAGQSKNQVLQVLEQ